MNLHPWYVPVAFGNKEMTQYPLNHRPDDGGMRVYMADQVDALLQLPTCICRPAGCGDGETFVPNPRCQAHKA